MTRPRLLLLAAVLVIAAVAVYLTGHRDRPIAAGPVAASTTAAPPAPPAPFTPTPTPPLTAATPAAPPAPSSSVPPAQKPPPLRQRPQLYPQPAGTDPATVTVVPAPPGPPTASELATPVPAAAAWAARWCPFSYTEPLGAAESRSQPAMTPAGWASFDPRTDPVASGEWAGVTAAGLTGTCSAPTVVISPEAPRSATAVYVTVSLTRVVTSTKGPTTVETVTAARLVLRTAGRWLVDTPAVAG